jgi:hypothetical protein
VVGNSFVAHTLRNKLNQKINKKNKQTNKNSWNNKNEEANGPSFLNQKTVLTL